MDVRDAVTLSLLPRAWRLRQPDATGEKSALARACEALDPCRGASSDAVFAPLLAALDPARDPATALRDVRARADAALARAHRAGLTAWPIGSASYPPLLAEIYDPPPLLWVRATADAGFPDAPAIAIVGSRAASAYALEVAAHLGSELGRRGVLVVSGLARGVDSAAHRGALEAGGRTLAVLGCGADVVYPAEHRGLADEVAASGALVSEFPPGTPPLPRHFPLRNRIISGLSRATVVVEASDRSGSLITAACALEQGREVMAVPGSVLSGRNRGSHALLKDGAKIVESSDDILEELGLGARATVRPHALAQNDALLRVMARGEPYDLEALTAQSGLDPRVVLARLAELELGGSIRRVEGGRFVRERDAVLR